MDSLLELFCDDDRRPVPRLVQKLSGKLFGDTGVIRAPHRLALSISHRIFRKLEAA